MKPQSEKLLNEIRNFVNASEAQDGVKERIKDLIFQILFIECESAKAKKFNIWSFTSKDNSREMLQCCHYENGFVVASDGRNLIKTTRVYDETREGMNFKFTGEIVDYKYPQTDGLIKVAKEKCINKIQLTEEIKSSYAIKEHAFKAYRKIHKKVPGIIEIADNVFVKMEEFSTFFSGVDFIGATEIRYLDGYNTIVAYNESEEIVLVMPCIFDGERKSTEEYFYCRL